MDFLTLIWTLKKYLIEILFILITKIFGAPFNFAPEVSDYSTYPS